MQIPDITTSDIKTELERRRNNRLAYIFHTPEVRATYAKHMEFIELGSKFRQRLFMAANRVGKSELGAFETVLHATGDYPDWWNGKRFNEPTNILVAGETGKLVRDSIQIKLLGQFGNNGTGLIPRHALVDIRNKQGIPDAVDIIKVKHRSGGVSTIQFQSYADGREAFQATARHVVWFDEEPPLSIYSEGLTRTMTTKGIVMTTFTPLKGISETVQFLQKKAEENEIGYITASWSDAPHLSQEDQDEMLMAYPPHQRDARSKGVPALGSGAIYPVPESLFVIDPFLLPKHWRKVFAMDVGWNNTAVVWAAYDSDSETIYVYDCYKVGGLEPAQHANAIKARGSWIRGVIDPAARGRSQIDGRNLAQMYVDLGLKVSYANNSVDAGINEVWQKLLNSQLKVFSTCKALIDEYRVYRRDEKGRIVKDNDHLMDSLRYLVMSGLSIATSEAELGLIEESYRINPSQNSSWVW